MDIDVKITDANKEEIFSLHLDSVPDELLIQDGCKTPGIDSLIKVLQSV